MQAVTQKIEKLISKYNTNCPFKIAERLGIRIEYEYLGKSLGYFSHKFRMKIIHINETSTEYQRKFICAHELGHAILHPNSNTSFLKRHTLFSTNKLELEANFFAVQLLFSEDFLNDHISLQEAVELYGIPEKFILNNLKGE